MDRRSFLSLGLGVAALSLSPLPVFAHHGWAGNEEKTSELTGVVEQTVDLSGPHATMKIRSGGQLWDITLAPPAATKRAGLEEKSIPVGATVMVHGNRNKDPKRFEM